MEWFTGCSGFYYKEWKESFYPEGLPQKQWFEYYCRHFNTIEINNTFYNFPQLKNLQSWYNRSPDAFAFSVKAPRTITHLQKFSKTEDIIHEFYDVVTSGLQQKLACILFQLPPSFSYSDERLQAIITQLNPTYNNVIEFRNSSWWQPHVYEVFKKNEITFCSASLPGLPDDVITNTGSIYYRFHGTPRLYYSAYTEDFLKNIIASIKENKTGKKAFLYFNNTASGAALDNAKFVQSITG